MNQTLSTIRARRTEAVQLEDIFYQNMESGNPYLKIFLPYQDNPSKETIN